MYEIITYPLLALALFFVVRPWLQLIVRKVRERRAKEACRGYVSFARRPEIPPPLETSIGQAIHAYGFFVRPMPLGGPATFATVHKGSPMGPVVALLETQAAPEAYVLTHGERRFHVTAHAHGSREAAVRAALTVLASWEARGFLRPEVQA